MSNTVGELIARLQELDPSTPVGRFDDFQGVTSKVGVHRVKMDPDNRLNWRPANGLVRYTQEIEDRMINIIVLS